MSRFASRLRGSTLRRATAAMICVDLTSWDVTELNVVNQRSAERISSSLPLSRSLYALPISVTDEELFFESFVWLPGNKYRSVDAYSNRVFGRSVGPSICPSSWTVLATLGNGQFVS